MNRKKWIIANNDKELAKQLAEECDIDQLVALILTARGYADPFEIDEFLSPDQQMCDPYELIDMDKAVERIRKAIEDKEKIAVYGDYDVDGVTSTALMFSYLTDKGADVIYSVPEREDGYGMNNAAVDRLKADGVSLIITVDNGVGAINEIDYAASLGIDVVVTDHHLPMESLPNAVAVVDPHRADCTSHFKDYSGAGVAFKVICALEEESGEEMASRYGDLAAVGTIADVMPLVGENRLIVKNGLPYVTDGREGFSAIIDAAGLGGRAFTSSSVSYGIGPRLNAAGRVGSCERAVRLLLTNDKNEARELAEEINADNMRRQQTEREIFDAAIEVIEKNGYANDRIIVVCGDGWHGGVIGIVASRICERYGRPAFVLSVENGEANGSARSIGGFSVFDALSACESLLTRFGGHSRAAGMAVKTELVDDFRKAINNWAAENFEEMPFAEIHIDCRLSPSVFSVDMAQSLEAFEPCGVGNQTPVFGIMGVRVDRVAFVGNGKHLRLNVSKNGANATIMLFNTNEKSFGFSVGDLLDFAVTVEQNEYMGSKTVTLIAKAFRPSGVDEERLFKEIRIYERFLRGESLNDEQRSACALTRDDIAAIYRLIYKNGEFYGVFEALMTSSGVDSYLKMRLALDVLSELGLIKCEYDKDSVGVKKCPVDGKLELSGSKTYRKANGEEE
ncbi:MAG: single-stranded-DNA-specific exonuclease RecJ [Clostridia bacterium]|nr:single-stranded-DNA-specific exonuclease RecJ [Clostridia bacterium]